MDCSAKEAKGHPQQPPVSSLAASPPYYVSYVDALADWWPPEAIAKSIGATDTKGYNIINLSFWTPSAPVDAALVWSNPVKQFGNDSQFGSTNEEIQRNLVQLYHQNNALVLVSAFGATSHPTTEGVNASTAGAHLGQFVIDNNLDGVDLDYEDNAAMEKGTAYQWLVDFTNAMLSTLDDTGKRYVISHAPQAPYFMDGKYPQNYVTIYNAPLSNGATLGSRVDFFNIQFYNQATSAYSTYQSLFLTSDGWATGTAVQQIANKGIPMEKIVVGKPVTQGDAAPANTGYVAPDALAGIFSEARQSGAPWQATVGGVMSWQFKSDTNGDWIQTMLKVLPPSNIGGTIGSGQ